MFSRYFKFENFRNSKKANKNLEKNIKKLFMKITALKI